MTANDNTTVLTVSEVMLRWKASRKSVLAMIHDGRLHAFRIGKSAYRVPMSAVLGYESRAA